MLQDSQGNMSRHDGASAEEASSRNILQLHLVKITYRASGREVLGAEVPFGIDGYRVARLL